MTRERAAWLGLLVLALTLRLGLLYYLVVVRPTNIVRDSIEYINIARGLRLGEGYEFLLGYLVARPPLFPLAVAGIQELFGEAPVYVALFNLLVSSLTCLVGYALARRLGGNSRVAFVTALILAVDPSLVVLAVSASADPLANLFLGLCLVSLAKTFRERQPADALWAGLWLALSLLTRPNSLYFVVAGAVIFYLLLPRIFWWRYYVLFALLPVAAGFGWAYRNYTTAGVFTFASVADFNMLFYRAVAVEHWATGDDPDAIRRRYAYELERRLGSGVAEEEIDSGYFWNNFAPHDPRRLAAMRSLAIEVYLAYPFWYVATIPAGLYNMFALSLRLPVWPPLEIAVNFIFYLVALRGLWLAWRSGDRRLLVISVVTLAYFVAATLASQTTGMSTRMRSPFTILLALLAAQGSLTPIRLGAAALVDKKPAQSYNRVR